MTFSDADLKRLKEVIATPFKEVGRGDVEALLARLEAAEDCLELPHMKHTETTEDMKCTFCTRYKAWRKAAGK